MTHECVTRDAVRPSERRARRLMCDMGYRGIVRLVIGKGNANFALSD